MILHDQKPRPLDSPVSLADILMVLPMLRLVGDSPNTAKHEGQAAANSLVQQQVQ